MGEEIKKFKTIKDIGMIPHGEYCFSEETEHGNELMLFESDLKNAAREWIKSINEHDCDFRIKSLRMDITIPEQYLIEWIEHFFNLEEE